MILGEGVFKVSCKNDTSTVNKDVQFRMVVLIDVILVMDLLLVLLSSQDIILFNEFILHRLN